VEVRNDWRVNGRQQASNGQQINGGGLFVSKSSEDDSPVNEDPILAVVTVPLSSINIEDEDDNSNDNNNSGKGSPFKRRTTKARNGASSTNITIPLCMSCCSHAPIGSISLKITIKVPSRPEGQAAAATNNSSRSVVNNASVIPSVPSLPNSNEDISNLQVDINIRGSGSSSTSGNGEVKVNESIELGPLSILMDGWSLGGSASREQPDTAAAKDNPDRESQTTTSTTATSVPEDRKLTSPQSQSRSQSRSQSATRDTTNNSSNNNGENDKKRKRLRWSKQFDHQTKKWSNLKNSNNTPTSNGGATTLPTISSSTKNSPSSPSRKSLSPKKEEEAIATNDGWFTFLNRESAREVVGNGTS